MSSNSHSNRVSRRRFLQGAAALGGLSVLAACTPSGAPADSGGGAASGEAANILVRLNGIDAPGQEFADQFAENISIVNS